MLDNIEKEDKIIAAILTYIKFQNETSWRSEDTVVRAYLNILKAISQKEEKDINSQIWEMSAEELEQFKNLSL